MKGIRNVAAAALAAVLGLAAAGPAAAQQQTIAELVVMNDDFDTLETALKMAELVPTFQQPGPYTVFAPTDAAFEKIPDATLQQLLRTEQRLASVLQYHVVSGQLTAAELQQRDYVTTLSGERLPVRVVNGGVMVGGAMVTQANVQASNGVVHAIGSVLMPPMPVQKGQ